MLFAVASFVPRLLSFFLLRLYTAKLSESDYGTVDLLNSIVSVALPILMYDISDAILINTVKYKGTQKQDSPFVYGIRILLLAAIEFTILVIGGSMFTNSDYKIYYCIYMICLFICYAYQNNLLSYLRGIDAVSIITVSAIISSIVTIACNLVTIMWLDMGVLGLMTSTCLGTIAQSIYSSCKIRVLKIIKSPYRLSKENEHDMLKYSFPLIFAGLAWWVNNSSDRLFISMIVGVSYNGLYAVASKIPNILSLFTRVISQALQLSIYNEVKDGEAGEYLKHLYELYIFLISMVCSILIILTKFMSKILFSGSFYEAWRYVPGLISANVIYACIGYITDIEAATSRTSSIAKATILGAVLNSVLNLVLIPHFNVQGAVTATVVSYFVIWLVIALHAQKTINIKFGILRNISMFLILIVQWIFISLKTIYFINITLMFLLIVFNYRCLAELLKIGKSILRKIKGAKRGYK